MVCLLIFDIVQDYAGNNGPGGAAEFFSDGFSDDGRRVGRRYNFLPLFRGAKTSRIIFFSPSFREPFSKIINNIDNNIEGKKKPVPCLTYIIIIYVLT